MEYKILGDISSPEDVKRLGKEEIKILCDEMRSCIIDTVSQNGGHLASNLGAVELTVALHRAFSSPKDAILFDVGHQSYPHKLLTGRFEKFHTVRQQGGLSGFMRPQESAHDPFVTGHSSNSISAAYGIYTGKRLSGETGSAIAVIGDGALTGGMAYEGLNNAGECKGNFIVVLNDNEMSISNNVGGLACNLAKLRNKIEYHRLKFVTEKIIRKIPFVGNALAKAIYKIKEIFKSAVYGNNMFSSLGFNYLGPVDGHNVEAMEELFKIAAAYDRPTLVHVVTTKGKGYSYAEDDPRVYHGVSSFDAGLGIDAEKNHSFSDIAGDTLCRIAEDDKRICAITAAMTAGTGLGEFAQKYKDRFFDVGIAEEHAVTFSAGLIKGGMKPFFAVYSSFLQRGFDQVLHDAAIEGIPLKLLVDRAGIVGEDGESHQGVFDVAILSAIPGMVIYAPCFYNELELLIEETADNDEMCAIRYPRGTQNERFSSEFVADISSINKGTSHAIATYGRLYAEALSAAEGNNDFDIVRFTKICPIEYEHIETLMKYDTVDFFEEGIKNGGVAERVGAMLLEAGFKGEYTIHAIDNKFVPQASVGNALKECGLDAEAMRKTILERIEGKRNNE